MLEIEVLSGLAAVRHHMGQVTALTELARIHAARRDLAAATDCADEAVRLARRHRFRRYEGRALHARAEISLVQEHCQQAHTLVTQALAVHRDTGQRLCEARDLLLLADLLRRMGDTDTADAHASEAARICVSTAGTKAYDVLRTMTSCR